MIPACFARSNPPSVQNDIWIFHLCKSLFHIERGIDIRSYDYDIFCRMSHGNTCLVKSLEMLVKSTVVPLLYLLKKQLASDIINLTEKVSLMCFK